MYQTTEQLTGVVWTPAFCATVIPVTAELVLTDPVGPRELCPVVGPSLLLSCADEAECICPGSAYA